MVAGQLTRQLKAKQLQAVSHRSSWIPEMNSPGVYFAAADCCSRLFTSQPPYSDPNWSIRGRTSAVNIITMSTNHPKPVDSRRRQSRRKSRLEVYKFSPPFPVPDPNLFFFLPHPQSYGFPTHHCNSNATKHPHPSYSLHRSKHHRNDYLTLALRLQGSTTPTTLRVPEDRRPQSHGPGILCRLERCSCVHVH